MMFNIKNTNVTFFCFIEDSKQVFALMLTYHKSLFILNIFSFYQQKKEQFSLLVQRQNISMQ